MRLGTKCSRARTSERLCSLMALGVEGRGEATAPADRGAVPASEAFMPWAGVRPGARQGAERKLFGHEVRMTSEEALIGTRVRVHNSLERADLRGREGKILRRLGSPDYVALDVLLDDGTQELFWHHELDEVDGV